MKIIELTTGLFNEVWILLLEMAPYLLFGLFVAGILHVLFPSQKIYKYFSGNSLKSIVRASLFGVPLPLCSCGVIPVAAHLKREGAGDAPTLSFLISTPTTGVDSILATYALLGPFFAIIRPVSAFFAGCLAGGILLLTTRDKEEFVQKEDECVACEVNSSLRPGVIMKAKEIFRYAFF
ncbi:MAG: permease, partial [Candidatus Aureabacteria bacterium]|nr:permease [Candidatus Auribacterota bacterium]